MKRTARNILLLGMLALSSWGCMGQMGLTQKTIGVNLKLVDNRFGRATIYFFAAPVYGFVSMVDLLVLNSIEFWTGTNPITGKSPLVDTDADSWLKIDEKMPESMTKPALEGASLFRLGDDTMALQVVRADGTKFLLTAQRVGDHVLFYLGDELIAEAGLAELQAYANKRREVS